MAQVSFNFYDKEQRINFQLKADSDVHFADNQIDRFIEFLLAQGFQEASIYHHLDTLVEEYDNANPGKLDQPFGF